MNNHLTISLKPNRFEEAPLEQAPRKKRRLRRFMAPLLGLVVVVLVFFVCWWGFQKVEQALGQTPGNEQAVVEAVGKLMLLPQNETPTVAVVSDLSKLQGQPFFANAEQGDVVLMYAQADRAILYSPARNKIIQVAPIANEQQQQQ